jgi:hypothetical protein
MRQEKSKPLVEALKTWLEQQLKGVSAKPVIAKPSATPHWDGLTLFLDDGRIELDTNIVELRIRPIALNRKNALFAGHDQGAENWACIASLIETCKLCGVERKPISPTCSPRSSTDGRRPALTSSCLGPGWLSAAANQLTAPPTIRWSQQSLKIKSSRQCQGIKRPLTVVRSCQRFVL